MCYDQRTNQYEILRKKKHRSVVSAHLHLVGQSDVLVQAIILFRNLQRPIVNYFSFRFLVLPNLSSLGDDRHHHSSRKLGIFVARPF